MRAMWIETGSRSVAAVFSTFEPVSVATKKALKRSGNAPELPIFQKRHLAYLVPDSQAPIWLLFA